MVRRSIVIIGIVVFASLSSSALALGPYVNYQGRILDAQGQPAKDGNHLLTFALYDKEAEGEALWTEQQYVTTVEGTYSLLLGAVNPVPSLEENRPLYLAIAQAKEDIAKVERAQIIFLVPDGIDTRHIKDGAVTAKKLAAGLGMTFVYNDFADSTTTAVGQEVALKRYTMPANTLKKGMLVTVTGESFAYGAALSLYVNGHLVKTTAHESQLDGLIRVGLGTINARVTGLPWDKAITVEVRGVITTNVGATRMPQEVTCTSLTVMGD